MNKPKVSILCITYNQARYISQTLDSFLAQKTDFDFEILVHDDASIDGTTQILTEYKEKHPNKIKLVVQKHNQYKKGVRGMFPKYLFPIAKGDYLALCEGDDYWSSPNKLQKQVNFLDKHKDYSICFHSTKWIYPDDNIKPKITPDKKIVKNINIHSLLIDNFIHTSSVMYRCKNNQNIIDLKNIYGTDWYLNLYNAQFGAIGFIDEVMSVYRKHKSGISYNAHKNIEALLDKYWFNIIVRYFEELKMFKNDNQSKQIAIEKIKTHLDALHLINSSKPRKRLMLTRLKFFYRDEFKLLDNHKVIL